MPWVRAGENERERREDVATGDVAEEIEWMVDTATHRIFSRPRRVLRGEAASQRAPGPPVLPDGSADTRR